MQRIIGFYASILQRHRMAVAIGVLLTTVVFVYNISQLKTDLQMLGAVKVDHQDESADEQALVKRTESSCVVILSCDDVFTSTGISIVRELEKELVEIQGVTDVESLLDMHVVQRLARRPVFLMLLPPDGASAEKIKRAKELALRHPIAAGNLISSDATAMALTVSVDPSVSDIGELRRVTQQIHARVSDAIQGTKFSACYTGMPEIRVQTSDVIVQDQVIFNIIGALAGLTVNCFLLRRVAAVAIVSVGSWLGTVWTFGIFGLMGQPLTPINGIVAPLAMTIALTDSIHLLLNIRRMREAGLSRDAATLAAVREVGIACTLTSLTTVVGFMSLSVAELGVLRNLGCCCAVAVIAAYCTVMTVVPLLSMTWLGDYISAPASQKGITSQFTLWLAKLVTAHRWAFFIGGLVATILLAVCATRLHSDSRLAYALPSAAEKSLRYSDEKFGGTIPVILHVEWAQGAKVTSKEIIAALESLHHALAKSKNMSPAMSLLNVLQLYPESATHGPAAAFRELKYWPARARDARDLAIDLKKRSMYVYLRSRDAGSHALSLDLKAFGKAHQELRKEHPEFTFRLLRSVVTSSPVANQIVSDLMLSMMLAVPVTLVIIALSLGSSYYGFVAFLPNTFPMFALAASLVLCGQPLLLVGAVVFTFSFGVAVDDTIHVLNNFKDQYSGGGDVTEAIAAVYQKVGGALVASTLILFAGMGVVLLSHTLLVRAFGALFCVALAFALVADLLILPATLACFPPKRKEIAKQAADPEDSPRS